MPATSSLAPAEPQGRAARPDTTAVILAGGQGRRLGGLDKGLVELAGRLMVSRIIERLAPQTEQLMINANRHLKRYRSLGYPVIEDLINESAGPLAGFHTALSNATTPLVVVVPCDTPSLPHELVPALWSTMQSENAHIVYARDAQRAHPAVALLRVDLARDLGEWLDGGGRKIDQWYARHQSAACLFGDPRAFININTPEDRDAFTDQDVQ